MGRSARLLPRCWCRAAPAWWAEVTQLFWASSTTLSPSIRAVDSGAQKWLREPASENASVERWRPAAISRRTASEPNCSRTAVPALCMLATMAVDAQARDRRSTTIAAARGP